MALFFPFVPCLTQRLRGKKGCGIVSKSGIGNQAEIGDQR